MVTSALDNQQTIRCIPLEDHLRLPLDAGDGADSPLSAIHFKVHTRRFRGSRARSLSPDLLQSVLPEAVDDDEGFVDGISDD